MGSAVLQSKVKPLTISVIFFFLAFPLMAQYSFASDYDIFSPMPYDAMPSVVDLSFQPVPPSAPWLVQISASAKFDAHDINGSSEKKMHPALRSFLRFLIVGVGVMPVTIGLSSILYLSPPQGWSTTQQAQVVLISGASAAITVALIDMIVDLIIQAKRKEG